MLCCVGVCFKIMPEESHSSISHLYDVTTTTNAEEVQTTGKLVKTSSTSHGVDFYFQSAVVVIGVTGVAANALVLYAMVASKQHKKQLLIFNQNVFDFCSSLLLIITFTLKLCDIHLTGVLGYWLCMMLLSENIFWWSINASVINLMSITIERYLKVVHSTWSKKWLRKSVKCSAVAFAWIAGVVYNMIVVSLTSDVVDGVCYGYVFWKSQVVAIVHGIWNFVSFTVVVVFVFIFCYARILAVVRRQAMVMAGHSGPASSAAQSNSHHIQTNVVKMMITVSAFYVITWAPCNVYFLLLNFNTDLTLIDIYYYVSLFFAFFYICANPFIYATKFDPVKRVLVDLIPCKKSQQAGGGVEMSSTTRTVASRFIHVQERY